MTAAINTSAQSENYRVLIKATDYKHSYEASCGNGGSC